MTMQDNNGIKQFDEIITRNFYITQNGNDIQLTGNSNRISERCRFCGSLAKDMKKNGSTMLTFFGYQNSSVVSYSYEANRLRCGNCSSTQTTMPEELRGVKYLNSYLTNLTLKVFQIGFKATGKAMKCTPKTVRSLYFTYQEWIRANAFFSNQAKVIYLGTFTYMDEPYVYLAGMDRTGKMHPLTFFEEKNFKSELAVFTRRIFKDDQDYLCVIPATWQETLHDVCKEVRTYFENENIANQEMMLDFEKMKSKRRPTQEYLTVLLMRSWFIQVPELRIDCYYEPKLEALLDFLRVCLDKKDLSVAEYQREILCYFEKEPLEIRQMKVVATATAILQKYPNDSEVTLLEKELKDLISRFEEDADWSYKKYLMKNLHTELDGKQLVGFICRD